MAIVVPGANCLKTHAFRTLACANCGNRDKVCVFEPPASSNPGDASDQRPLKLLDEAVDSVEPDAFAGFEAFSGVFHVSQRRNSVFAGDRRSV